MLGQDTEYFLWDTKEDKYVPSWHYLPAPKDKKSPWAGTGSCVFRDGFAMEINTPPETCRAYMWENHKYMLRWVRKEFEIPKHIIFSTRPVVDISEHLKDVTTWPEDLRVLGCNPTLDAYTGDRKEIKRDPLTLPFRTSGAHMHISGEVDSIIQYPQTSQMFIKLCDLFLGIPHTVIFGDDLEFQRRTLYGTAGEYRMQEYPQGKRGIEYRVLSTRMWCHPAVVGLSYGIMRGLIAAHFNELCDKWNPNIEKPLRKAINTGVGALEMFEDMEKLFDFSRLSKDDYSYDRVMGVGGEVHEKFRKLPSGECTIAREYKSETAKPDVWLKLRAKVNPNLNAEVSYLEAHHGFNEYMAEWYPGKLVRTEIQ